DRVGPLLRLVLDLGVAVRPGRRREGAAGGAEDEREGEGCGLEGLVHPSVPCNRDRRHCLVENNRKAALHARGRSCLCYVYFHAGRAAWLTKGERAAVRGAKEKAAQEAALRDDKFRPGSGHVDEGRVDEKLERG